MADDSKPYIGYRSAGRRPERQNDREGSKGAPLAAIRGWVAGTAGLPGDLEGLVRMLPSIDRKDPVLPTSEFYKEWLPLRGDSAVERAFTDAGSLAGGAGTGTAARALKTGATVGSRGALSALNAAARNAAVPRTLSPQAGVIKMKGGNWLDGSVEDALKGLKRGKYGFSEPYTREHLADLQRSIAEVPERAGSVLNSIGKTELEDMLPKVALNDWIDKKLTRYVKNEMATPEDPVRALAERGVLHYQPPGGIGSELRAVERYRKEAGFDTRGVSKSDLASNWEDRADSVISPELAGVRAESANAARARYGSEPHPWLGKIDPNTPVYDFNMRNSSLGFDHLIDELRNATNPESGLPRELLLKYDALDRVTVPQAVERVAKINKWRAAQKAEADLVRANNAATVLHKEYPEGYRWVELKKGEQFPEGWSEARPGVFNEPSGLQGYEDPRMQALKDALKYEGDTMGHCVGGYCDDVASGKSRIYSLRDQKGQPHATIEVTPGSRAPEGSISADQLPPEVYADFEARGILDPSHVYVMNERLGRYLPATGSTPDRIVQIKGKQNRAPNPEYLPYIQDFVRSGNWSNVGDLHNTGLVDLQGMRDVPEHLKSGSRFLTQQEYDDAVREFVRQQQAPGFRRGGLAQVKKECSCGHK